MAELHSRMAAEAASAAKPPAASPTFGADDVLLLRGILQHVDAAAIRATCVAQGGETAKQVGARVAALTAKLLAAATGAAAPAPAPPPAARGGTSEPLAAAVAASPGGVGAVPATSGGAEDADVELDGDEEEQLDTLLAEWGPTQPDGGQSVGRGDFKKRFAQHTARLVSKRLKGKGASPPRG